jgi:hypothetical protein
MIDSRLRAALGIVLFVTLGACQPQDGASSDDLASQADNASPSISSVVEVIAADFTFAMPSEIPSGWVTFEMRNEGREHHFFLLNLLPDGKTLEEYQAEVATPFDSVWHALNTGSVDKAEAGQMLGSLLPEWYASVRQMGGTGLTAPGRTARTTANLEPGLYVMECYVKTPDGTFHTSLGMQRQITVTDTDSGGSAPEADVNISLSNFQILVEGEVTPGEHTVAVHFQAHPEFGLGNDIHLVRLDDEVSLDDVILWMDWMNIGGLRSPAPASFLGGTQEMPIGHTAYFTVDLEPGRYAWIAESTAAQGMVKQFTVE